MYAAKNGQDYVMERFVQDLHRPDGYFESESKLRLKILAQIEKKPKRTYWKVNYNSEIVQSIQNGNRSFDETTWIKLNCIVLLLSVLNCTKTRFCTSSN